MIKINILPQQLKNEIKLKILDNFFKKTLYLLIFCFLVFCSILFGAEHYLKKHYDEITAQNESRTKDSENYSKKIKEINAQIASIKKIQESEINWTDLVLKISKNINSEVKIKSLSIDKKTGSVRISGNAETRDGLLSLKNDLEKSLLFSEIKLPIKTMLEQSDIDFEINTSLNINEF